MQPFALLHRDGADHVEVLTGDVITVGTLAEIPFEPGRPTLALIPYRQITERGFSCVDDDAPLECLRVSSRAFEPLAAFRQFSRDARAKGMNLDADMVRDQANDPFAIGR